LCESREFLPPHRETHISVDPIAFPSNQPNYRTFGLILIDYFRVLWFEHPTKNLQTLLSPHKDLILQLARWIQVIIESRIQAQRPESSSAVYQEPRRGHWSSGSSLGARCRAPQWWDRQCQYQRWAADQSSSEYPGRTALNVSAADPYTGRYGLAKKYALAVTWTEHCKLDGTAIDL